jgi:shikimate dehydrogenase
MRELINGETYLYPIIGDPIIYVESPQRLTAQFEALRHNGICVPMQVRDGELKSVIEGLSCVPNVRGLLVTMPHKNKMFPYCSTSSETSRLLGVVSVVRRNSDGTWHGDMLDGEAFVAAQQKAGVQHKGMRVLQVGTGGVGSAIAVALLRASVRELSLYDTNGARLNDVIARLSTLSMGRIAVGSVDPTGYDIVINATQLGMSPVDGLPVLADRIISSMFVSDVIAGHGITPFIEMALSVGCKTSDGSEMVAVMTMMSDFFLRT